MQSSVCRQVLQIGRCDACWHASNHASTGYLGTEDLAVEAALPCTCVMNNDAGPWQCTLPLTVRGQHATASHRTGGMALYLWNLPTT